MNRTTPPPPPTWPSPYPADVAFRQTGQEWDAEESDLPEGLLPEERALLPEAATEVRVRDFMWGRWCARQALAALAPEQGEALLHTPILRDGERRPAWPAGFVGAITHHRGYAAAAAARAADYLGLGLDLEAVREPSEALVRRILRPEERTRWASLGAAERPAAFVRTFSAKESLYKALYPHTGIYLGFQDAAVEMPPPLPGTVAPASHALRWRLHRDSGPGFLVGTEGVGSALTAGGYVLTAVWIRRSASDG